MNINRDYLIINDVKKSNVTLGNGSMFFYITDKNTQNIFVNLVINVSKNDLIQKFANIENAEDYTLTMNIVKPDNTYKVVEGKLHDKENAIFEFDLNEDCCDEIGTYRCELLTKCNINDHEEITTSNKLSYKVKSSVLNDLNDIVEAPEYPLVIQLFDKLSDIEQYEEDRRANELARQLAEEQRQTRFNALDTDMTDSIQAIDDKVVDVENRISTKEQAVDKLIVDTKADINEYKVAKDQEIDDYKTAKDTEINEAITNQDNKIDTAISEQNDRISNAIATQDNKIDTAINAQNDRITVVENNDVAQDNRLNVLENKDVLHESRLDAIEVKNQQQDSRLDIVEAKNVEQDNRLNDIETKNTEQDDRLLDIEKVNKRQDMNLKCLFAESKNNMIDIAEEGNSIYLQNSTIGYTLIDEIKGNTLVNCNKEPNKELILNGNINTSGDNAVTITEGVDGGLVDVALEGNTLVNVSKTKDSTAISMSYTVENSGNHIALQGETDGSCRPVITGNTLWIDNDTEEVLTAFDETKNLRLQSTFEDNLVTQEMIDSGEEVADNLGKYRVDYKVTGKNKLNPTNSKVEGYLTDIGGTTQGRFTQYAGADSVSYICPCLPNTTYTVSHTGNRNTIAEFDKYPISGDAANIVYNRTLTTSSTTKWLVIYVNSTWTDDDLHAQLEEGDTATSYEPYKESTKTLYLNSPLLEGDTIEEKDNGIYHVHRGKIMTLTGDGSWGSYNVEPSGNSRIVRRLDVQKNSNILSPDIPNVKWINNPWNVTYNCISVQADDNALFIYNNSSSITDLETFKTWLTNNPVTIIYELASPTYELIEQSNLVIPSYANGHLDFNTAIPVEKVEFKPFTEELTYLYANTQYTVQFVSDKAITVDITLGGTQLLAQSIVAGLNRISITTPATLVDNKLVIDGVGANISKVVVTDTNREFGYFEGMKSVGECEGNVIEVLSTNKNLVDFYSISPGMHNLTWTFDNLTKTYHTSYNGNYCRLTFDISKYIPLLEGHKVRVTAIYSNNSITDAIHTTYMVGIDANGIQTSINTNSGLDIPKGKYEKIYAYFYVNNSSTNLIGTCDISNLQLEIVENNDNPGTDYIPHQSNTQRLTHEPLRAVGDAKDRYALIDGKWYIERKCGVRAYQEGDKDNYKTDLVNTVYSLDTPQYEPLEYNPLEVYSDVTHISTNSTIPTNITVKNHGFNCLLKPSTTYTISSNLGLNIVTTPSTLTEDCLRFMDTDTSDVTTMRDVLVLEGDWTSKADLIPSNFSGIESAFEQELVTDETDEHYGKYKVNIKVANENKTRENNITFYINEPLRGVGDVKDRVYVKDDKVIVQRNCTSRVFNGSDDENWFFAKAKSKTHLMRWHIDIKTKYSDYIYYQNNKFISVRGVSTWNNDYECFAITMDKHIDINISKTKANDINEFKQYLSENPVTVVYQLAEPTYEEVEYNDTKLFIESFKNSTLFYNSNVPVTSKLYYSYSVPLVDTVAQTASISDEQDSMIIDLATQVAVMEMMLM